MIHRYMFLSYLKSEPYDIRIQDLLAYIQSQLQTWQDKGLLSFALFQQDHMLCGYAEWTSLTDWQPWEGEVIEHLESWPSLEGVHYAVSMVDVYHDGVPNNPLEWRKERVVDERVGVLARLKPEMVASYVFYHYQLQEEKPEHSNKSLIIGLYRTLIFLYSEKPAIVSEQKPQGKLNTQHSPGNWHEVMEPHFDPWVGKNDESIVFQTMKLIFAW